MSWLVSHFGGGGDVISGTMTLGTLVAVIFYTGQFFNPINQLAWVLVQMQRTQADGERALELLVTEPGIKNSDAVKKKLAEWDRDDLPDGVAPDGGGRMIEGIEFRGFDFSYETIALVRASGGGKSTIVNLAARFYEPTGGAILVNGDDLRERSVEWYQSNLGIVLQSPHLFSGSVRENIRYGRLDASDEEVAEAARRVNTDDFIQALENGYDTDGGEGGNLLSTGQKQLVSFARTVLANPAIFIMDEATSSIDTEIEQLIQQGLQEIFEGRISFVIAHRLSTIRTADRILVIEKGRIIESGKHEELLGGQGHYHALYTKQLQREFESWASGALLEES